MQALITYIKGAKVYWYYIKGVPVRLDVYFRAGGIYQPKGKEGLAHLLEHVLVGESKKYSSLESSNAYQNKEQLGMGAHTSEQYITLVGHCFGQDAFKETLDFMAEKLRNSVINQPKVDRETMAIQNELANYAYNYPNTNEVILHNYLATGEPDQAGLVEGDISTMAQRITIEDLINYKESLLTNPSDILIIGGVKPTSDNIRLLERAFLSSKARLPRPIRLRETLPKKGVVIVDKIKNPSLVKSYIGFGWVMRFKSKQDFLDRLVYMRSLANPANNLYFLLRYKHHLVYDFAMDVSTFADGLQILSLHTSSDSAQVSKIKEAVANYLNSHSQVLSALSAQLRIEKKMLPVIYDGSGNIGSYQNYLLPAGVTLAEFEAYIKSANAEEIFARVKGSFSVRKVSILLS